MMVSERLRYVRVSPTTLDAFHALVQDPHVRRYLMDGQIFPREWSEARIRESAGLFERSGVGLWLAYVRATDALVGFCGFVEFPALHPDPELVYALRERYAGRGYATEMARTSITHARTRGRLRDIVTSVDEINRASLRVLEKLGFEPCGSRPGAFGPTLLLRLASARGPEAAVSDSPIACTLTERELAERRAGLVSELGRHRAEIRWLPDDAAFQYPSTAAVVDLLTEFVRVESRCCPFLRFRLTIEPAGGPVWLELTGGPGTREFLEAQVSQGADTIRGSAETGRRRHAAQSALRHRCA
jgi:ribosomal-protein-alanine N-acetyltransferase